MLVAVVVWWKRWLHRRSHTRRQKRVAADMTCGLHLAALHSEAKEMRLFQTLQEHAPVQEGKPADSGVARDKRENRLSPKLLTQPPDPSKPVIPLANQYLMLKVPCSSGSGISCLPFFVRKIAIGGFCSERTDMHMLYKSWATGICICRNGAFDGPTSKSLPPLGSAAATRHALRKRRSP